MSEPQHILVFRFSALGDVAMTVPVLALLLQQHPQLEITMVSNPFMKPLFEGIKRLHFYPADTKKEFQGLRGLHKLSRQLKSNVAFDAVADLHDVVRTKALRFFLIGKPMAVIDKGRAEKKELTRPVNKNLRPLKSTFQRYADVFSKLGLSITLDIDKGIQHRKAMPNLLPWLHSTDKLIGIAPFAKHAAKMYPLEKMLKVVELLSAEPGIQLIVFGSRNEAVILDEWEKKIPKLQSLAGKLSFTEELNVISSLSLMISMDSANMHLASLFGIPVVSIWGGTHPFLGFYGWGQSLDYAIQLDLPCRPSSVFGNKPCPVHGTQGCMEGITPEMICKAALAAIKKGELRSSPDTQGI